MSALELNVFSFTRMAYDHVFCVYGVQTWCSYLFSATQRKVKPFLLRLEDQIFNITRCDRHIGKIGILYKIKIGGTL